MTKVSIKKGFTFAVPFEVTNIPKDGESFLVNNIEITLDNRRGNLFLARPIGSNSKPILFCSNGLTERQMDTIHKSAKILIKVLKSKLT